MTEINRYLIGDCRPHVGKFILDGDVRAADPVVAVLTRLAGAATHRTYEARVFPADGDFEETRDAAADVGYWYVRTVHAVPDDLPVPRIPPWTDEELDAGDAVLRAHPCVAIVAARETRDSLWANRVRVSEESLEALVRNAYALSSPRGLGFLQRQHAELDDETVRTILANETRITRLSMDYVHGRSVKFHVFKDEEEGGLYIDADRERPWYDHTRHGFAELLERSLSEADKERNAPYLAALKDYVEGRVD